MKPTFVTASLLLGLALVLAPRIAAAQGRASLEVGAGYSFLSGADVADGYGAGWMASLGWRCTDWLTLIGEAGGNRHEQAAGFLTVDADVHAFLAGPHIVLRVARLRPFVQAQVGWSRLNLRVASAFPASVAQEDETDAAIQVGAGIDVPAAGSFDLRIALAYRRVFAVEAMSQSRVMTGLVYRF